MTEEEMVGWHHLLKLMSLGKLRQIVKDRKVWLAVVHWVSKNQTGLND